MDPLILTAILGALSAIFAGGGLWAFLSARATAKAANRQASTADWSGLMAYWQAEIKDLRNENNSMVVRLTLLEERRDADLQHIADLENHIWQQLPPPPPIRRLPRNNPDTKAP
jgi:hypothetical protein